MVGPFVAATASSCDVAGATFEAGALCVGTEAATDQPVPEFSHAAEGAYAAGTARDAPGRSS